MPVLMHISDLHRSSDEPISNAELLASLDRDLDLQSSESPAIPPPDALLVSGDLVMGAPLGDSNPTDVIAAQYRQAEEFLGELVDLLFESDRSRVVICPGNHDVDWCQSRDSMQVVPDAEYPSDVYGALASPGSTYRWNWDERALYRIVDQAAYRARMDSYWDFISRFYSDVDIHHLPTESEHPLLVELFDRRVLVAALNSCEANDCYRRRAEFNAESVARMHLDIRKVPWEYDLKIALWHHNTTGPPSADDYLHVEQIHALIEYGFRLGLHGHQHRSEIRLHELAIPAYGSLAVISAGSLAAGSSELPRGANRQYNMLELRDDLRGVRLHVRELEGATLGPRRFNAFGGKSFIDVTLKPVSSGVGTILDRQRLNRNAIITEAEAARLTGEDSVVLDLLLPLAASLDPYGRKLLTDSAVRSERWDLVREHLTPPQTLDESIVLVRAKVEVSEFEEARASVSDACANLGMSAPQASDLLDWIDLQELAQ